MKLETPISSLPGIGISYARKLKKLQINTVEDLIYHFPFRYDDFSKISSIARVKTNESVSVQGILWQIKNVRTRTGKFVTLATVADESAAVEIIWFNQPYLTKTLKPGMQISLSGKAQFERSKTKLISPSYEIITQAGNLQSATYGPTLHTGRLVPIYPETAGVTSKWLRTKIAKLLPIYIKDLRDYIPSETAKNQSLKSLSYSLSKIHLPQSYQEIGEARKRLSFDEIFLSHLMSAIRRKQWQENMSAPKMEIKKNTANQFIKNLPFTLTNSQQKAIIAISQDLKKTIPANRLLEGDVGSGKTVVAAYAALIAHSSSFDTLFAAPTEILAFQHQKTLKKLLKPFNISVGIWTGSKKQKGDITCGTHALLTSFKTNNQIGLVIVDEQHRFGVAQRAKLFLNQTSQIKPHLLTMTATPIPRTLALTLYKDLNLSTLSELPSGRKRVSTFVVPNSKRNNAYHFIEKEIKKGRQAFIITPFVEPSESMTGVRAATKEFEKLKKKFSEKNTLGLLHGKLSSKAKQAVIDKFRGNKIKTLVTTPVVEVGIDIPNATIMLIESAERFGLAQLHQLRGRVGRGEHKSYCFLFTDSNSQTSLNRLKSLEKIYIGFELAEIDLKARGAGEIFGFKQSGFENFKIADFSNRKLIFAAQTESDNLLESDPDLNNHSLLKEKVAKLQQQYSHPN